ncbi:1-acyl-sn-glycerol-3-phosphate acyltransferase [Pseudenhygromyxa sp. WMMC2535]|uniref:lysophospholipid acyltransferase family protein n=1 Tax=Pseudenhygromyxa sp. WMMC2535 TaxID=2712867 RepID=UPI0015580637|nr:lysophospholipid acyltransferase family protein [Pseudenhygromyxa sp. WMMC2535]NVB42877.1 1-acyl-sn-glycerol-3-phosphate acyltransferase [Pseudenhygromyxa sp. WMMC2535]
MRVIVELLRAWQWIRLFSLISWFHVFKLIGNIIDRRDGVIEQHIARLMSRRILEVVRMNVHVEGEENCRGLEHYALASNHLSYLDWVLILAHFPHSVSFIAKRIVTLMPVFGSYLRNRGVLIDRRKGVSARTVIREAAQSSPWPLVIFPEGTRSQDGELKPFKRAGIRILAEEGRKLLPVVLLGTFEALGKDDRAIRTRRRLGMIILPPLDPQELGVEEACNRLEQVIAETYEARRHEFGYPVHS